MREITVDRPAPGTPPDDLYVHPTSPTDAHPIRDAVPDAAYEKPRTVYRPFFDAIPDQTTMVGQATSLVVHAGSSSRAQRLCIGDRFAGRRDVRPRDAAVSWTPTPGQVGAHTIGFIVHDGVLPVRRDVTFAVVASKDQ